MKRRSFLQNTVVVAGGMAIQAEFFPELSFSLENSGFIRHFGKITFDPSVILGPRKRIPLDWPAFPVVAGNGLYETTVKMKFNSIKPGKNPVRFRITSAIDLREEVVLDIFLAESKQSIGTLNLIYSHPFQPFETIIDGKWITEINLQGIGLQMTKGSNDAWFFLADQSKTDNAGFQPQLLEGNYPGTEKEFFNNLYSMNSFSPFGWMGGCVQDALLELHRLGNERATETLRKQLLSYLDETKGIIFESPRTEPMDGRFNSIEDFLPFAAIVSFYPNHPSVQMAVDFCLKLKNCDGLIASYDHITTEGCYTLGYPLAQIAVVRNDRTLAETSLQQITHRIHYLSDSEAVFQRSNRTGEKGYRNWGRGVAWYTLGMAKTLYLLKKSSFSDLPQIPAVEKEFVRAMNWVSKFQNSNGMWSSFVDRPQTGIDTSTTAGIATAMVFGVRMGILPETYLNKAGLALRGLKQYLTADGFVTHVSQINRGGEALQENGYRVISQFGLGLMGQLWAGLLQK